MWVNFKSSWTLCYEIFQNNDEALICRTCIIVRTITQQLAWTPLEGYSWRQSVRASTWSYTLQKPLLGLPPRLHSQPSQSHLGCVWCFLETGTQTSPAAPQAPCPQWAEDYRSWLQKRLSKCPWPCLAHLLQSTPRVLDVTHSYSPPAEEFLTPQFTKGYSLKCFRGNFPTSHRERWPASGYS